MSVPSVAVIIAAHNAAATIARAVKSALAEPDVSEVIIVDDASNDGTAEAARRADDGSNRLKIVAQPHNTGPSAARNRAIAESTASWIGILDADDFFLPGRMKNLLTFADQADFVADDIGRVDENDIHGPRTSLLDQSIAAPRQITFAEFVSSNVTDRRRPRGEMGFLKPIMRRDFLAGHGLRYKEHMRLGEDYELYARAIARGARFFVTPKEGYVSVMRGNSLSGEHTATDLFNLRDCDLELSHMPGLQPRDRAALRRHYLSVDCRLQWRLFIIAFKNRDWRAAFATLLRPYPVPFYIFCQLGQQLILRTAKIIRA